MTEPQQQHNHSQHDTSQTDRPEMVIFIIFWMFWGLLWGLGIGWLIWA